jgi:hypothetical protein
LAANSQHVTDVTAASMASAEKNCS